MTGFSLTPYSSKNFESISKGTKCWNRPKGRFFHFYPCNLVLAPTCPARGKQAAEKVTRFLDLSDLRQYIMRINMNTEKLIQFFQTKLEKVPEIKNRFKTS